MLPPHLLPREQLLGRLASVQHLQTGELDQALQPHEQQQGRRQLRRSAAAAAAAAAATAAAAL